MSTEFLKPPIILIGNVRSGTSMLYRLFDAHPQVKSWYEPRPIWMYADPGRRHDRFGASDATPQVVRYIRKQFLKFQQRHGGLRIMEKTPSNVLRIPYVRQVFPESKLLYVVRDPLANLRSSELKWQKLITWSRVWERFWDVPKTQLPHYVARFANDQLRKRVLKHQYVSVWGVRYAGIYEDLERMKTHQVIAKQWVKACEQVETDLRDVDPSVVMRIRYEDFVDNPVEQFGQICAHFGLDFPEALAEHVRSEVDPGRREKWRQMDPQLIEDCLPILRGAMEMHGYLTPDHLPDGVAESATAE